MSALVLTFVAAFIGTALLIREGQRPEWRQGWLFAGVLSLWLGLSGMLALLILRAVS